MKTLVTALALSTVLALPAAAQSFGELGMIHPPIAADGAPRGLMDQLRPLALSRRLAQPFGARATDWVPLQWPLGRELHDGLLIVNYTDLDPNPNATLDYMGGTHNYDTHQGTDYSLYNFRLMDRGTPVRAAAAGTVAFMNDSSVYDRSCTFDWPDGGNWIWIDAGDGSYHEYYHLRRGSIAVKIGEHIAAGQFLGLVGSSGYSTFPHMHFETGSFTGPGDTYVFRDPNHGTANPLPSLWNVQDAYVGKDPIWFADQGVFTEAQVSGSIYNTSYCDILNPLPQPLVYGANETKLCMWFLYQTGVTDTATVVVRRPNGSVYGSFDFDASEAHFDWFWSWFFWNGGVSAADYGTWRIQTFHHGALLLDKPFTLGATTQWAPRFWPRSGQSFRLNASTQRDTLRRFWLGPAVTYSLLNAPANVALIQDSILTIGPSAQSTRSRYFQVVMSDAAAHRDTAWYHLVDLNKVADPPLAVDGPATPSGLRLAAAPVPFRGPVAISYDLPVATEADLSVYDLTGRRVRTIASGPRAAGGYHASWDGRDGDGHSAPAGVYFLRLDVGDERIVRRLVRLGS